MREPVPSCPLPQAAPAASSARRLLGGLGGLVAAGLLVLTTHAVSVAGGGIGGRALVAVADTDSVAVEEPVPPDLPSLSELLATDSLLADSLTALAGDTARADSAEAADALGDSLARLYFPERYDEGLAASLLAREPDPFGLEMGPYWRQQVELDSAEMRYDAREVVASQDVRVPIGVDLETYRQARLRQALEGGFRDLADQRARRGQAGRAGFGITIDIPGGNQSAFSTLFGKNEVDLRVNGQANVDAGMSYQENELQQSLSSSGGSINPDFGQELRLGITGTIGDKLRVNVNYDTQNQFDFENQVSLVYEGYDDDIVQRIEAGNVFLQTPSELIRGGQRLFGLRTDLRFGGLTMTAVASQQDAEGSELTLEGGSQTTQFRLAPYDYEDNAHFWLGFHFYNWWDEGHRNPNLPTRSPGFDRIENLEVWRFDPALGQATPGDETIVSANVLALADLAEPGPGGGVGPPRGVLDGARRYLAALGPVAPLPDPTLDQYTDADLALLRDSSSTFDFAARGLLQPDYAEGRFRRLVPGVDYDYDPLLGTLSLNRPLTEQERLAVAYQYRTTAAAGPGGDENVVEVGDYGDVNLGGNNPLGQRLVMKLLRASNPTPTDATWGLTMRNVYAVGGRQLTGDAFDLEVEFEPSGTTPQKQLPGVSIGQAATLLQVLGLDRLNEDGATQPDDAFDFQPLYTVDAAEGRVIFPFREPFGARLRDVLESDVPEFLPNFTGTDPETAQRSFVFDTLYVLKPAQAERLPNISRYGLVGQFRSSVQSTYELGFGVVEGSVRVTAGGIELAEGADYQVNYTSGTVEIVNRSYLAGGQNVSVEYERNQFAAIGSKTLLGLRADYALSEGVGVGATWMRLAERPLVDKYRIGEEPIQNAIFGLDARYEADPRWVTRLVDALPFLQTRAPSRFEFKGEFAQLIPGHPQTFAFDRARDALRDDSVNASRDFSEDELSGISYLDDFEGTENVLSLLAPGDWRMAAPPTGAGPADARDWTPGLPVTDDRLRSNWRGRMGWYALPRALYDDDDLCAETACDTRATRELFVRDVFPQRETERRDETIQPLDLYFDPTARGPYNYSQGLTAFAADPRSAWSGMVQRLREGYTDFTGRNNIEFVEFIVNPVAGKNGDEPVQDGAVLYLDLGSVSEDVVPNGLLNSEDGLVEVPITANNADVFGRLPGGGSALNTVDLNEATNKTEDLGLDGLRSTRANPEGEEYVASELDDAFFGPFVNSLQPGPERALAEEDPSADDFHHFAETAYWTDPNRYPGGATLQERHTRFFAAPEFDALESQSRLSGSGEQGTDRFPDSEDLNQSTSLDENERFFRYEIPLDDAGLRESPYFQDSIRTPTGETWYLVRVPVRSPERDSVGGIQDFSLIEAIRLWTTGHDRPVTLRFATLELVGSQWLKSDRIGFPEDETTGGGEPPGAGAPALFIETINNEESPNQYAIPAGAIVSLTRDLTGRPRPTREQALVFRVEDLPEFNETTPEGSERAIYRPFSSERLDLTKYTNLRLFVHGEGFARRDNVRTFLRLGANETEDYYEIEQPVYPYEPPPGTTDPNPDSLWQTAVRFGDQLLDLNSINLPLTALNQLKAARDAAGVALTERYTTELVGVEGLPPGARLYIRGNPSIRTVSTLAMGVRNATGGDLAPLSDVEVWFNELRATGYEEAGGWSAYARTTVRLADFADVNARFSRQTDGFGDLGGGLGERAFEDQQAFTLQANLNADKVLPERFGWAAPINFSVQQSLNTPRFDPRRGDVRVAELVEQAALDSTLSDEERAAEVAQLRRESETAALSQSVRFQLSKTGSRSPWLRYTLDGLSLVFQQSAERRRSPSQIFNDRDAWSANASYRLTVPRPRTLRPFWFAEEVPGLSVLSRLRFNYLPQSFRLAANADRSVSRDQERRALGADTVAALRGVPFEFLTPERRTHQFGHNRDVELQYNPFTFLALGYRSDLQQSLATAGADEQFRLFVRDSLGNSRTYDLSRTEAFFGDSAAARFDFDIPASVDSLAELNDFLASEGFTVYEVRDLDVRPLGEVLSRVSSGERGVITDRYGQNLTATLQPTLDRVRLLAWFRPQPLSYSTQFTWDYNPVAGLPEDQIVANVQTQAQLRGGVTLRPREFWRLFPFYRRLEESDRQRGQQAARPPGRPEPGVPPDGEQEPGEDTAPAEGAADAPEDGAEGVEGDVGGDEAGAPEAEQTGGAPRRGFNPLTLGRRLFLSLTGVEDLTVTYNGSQTSAAGGLDDPAYSLYDALGGRGPSLGYRLGLDRRIPAEDRFADDSLLTEIQDNLQDNHRLDARTSLRLSSDLQINLTWNVGWNDAELVSYTAENDALNARPSSRNGGGEATILAFGGSYQRLLERQQERLERDVFGQSPNADGTYTTDLLSSTGLTEDFRSAFARGLGPFGPNGLLTFPMPNWDVTYSGLARLPLLRAFAQQATLRHGYSATYRVGYRSNALAGQLDDRTLPLGSDSYTLVSETPDLDPSTVTVNERFQPLVGANVSWKGGFQTEVNWNRSNSYDLRAAAGSVDEGKTEEVSARVSYAKTGIRIPLFGRRLNNNLRFTLTLSRLSSTDQTLTLSSDLESLLQGTEPQRAPIGSVRLSAEPRISYSLSNQVNMDLFLRYASVTAQGSQIPDTSELDGGVSFRVSFSN